MTLQENPPGPDKQGRTSHRNQKPSWAGLEAEDPLGHDMTSGALTGSLSNRFHIYDRGTGGWNGLRGHKKRAACPRRVSTDKTRQGFKMFLWAQQDKHGTPGRDVWTGSTGLGSAAAGGHESAAIRRAWGSGNPGTRRPAGGLGITTAGGGYLPRSAGMRAHGQQTRGDPAELPRHIRGLRRE